jgi:hypothetical protein
MDPAAWTNDFLAWTWERHHNVLSWYIRPLFVLPLAYFSYRRSLSGIGLTLVALATSMFWFPAPERVDPRVEEFLAFERGWLTGEWTLAKAATTLLVPLILGMMCLAFWRRSLVWGLVVMNAMAAGKVAWGVIDGGGTGWAMLPPALAGLSVCDAILLYAAHRVRAKSSRRFGRAGMASAHTRGNRA